ncbi:MAG: DNA gyrase subunit A [Candidatus Lokiarchaeota archaeon]
MVSEQIEDILLKDEMKSSYIDYSMSVIVGRAIPDVRDGLKPVHRRIIHAMLSTEARLSRIAEELIEDIEKDTVDFIPNFDESTVEPVFFPAKLPNMLINGTKGIAVGMATSMAPHNLTEICNGIIATIKDPNISTEELMEIIKGPDFPTGGIILGTNGIYNAYSTGTGTVNLTGRIETETKGKNLRLVITEIPYLLNKTSLIESIAKLIKDGVLKDVRDLRDESDRKGMRIVIELSKNAQPLIIKNILHKRTRLYTTFNITNLVLINDGKQPKILSLKELIQEYIDHRLIIIQKRTEYLLKKAQARLHLVEGLLVALADIDTVINIIKTSKDSQEAKDKIIKAYNLSDLQVQAILSMTLSKLTNLEQQKLKEEQDSLVQNIAEYNRILGSRKIRLEIIVSELKELNKKYGDKRRTEIQMIEEEEIREIKRKDLIKKEPTIVIFTNNQYIKRISVEEYHAQGRGGRGKKGMTVREEDFIIDLFVCSTHDTILIFTSKGRVYSIKCFDIPLQTRTARGKPIINLIALQDGETISSMIPINNFNTNEMLIMTTKNGTVKKTPLRYFSKFRSTGVRAQRIRADDKLVSVKRLKNELQDIFIATKCQRTSVKEYRKTGRGAKGVKNITLDQKRKDKVIAIKIAKHMDLLIGTEQGQVIRVPVDSIRITHRKAKGVRVIKLYEGDSVVAIGKCDSQISQDTDD